MAGKKSVSLTESGPPAAFFDDVRSILQRARRQAYAASNFMMVEAYWQIGQRIVQQEQGGSGRAEYGKHLICDLSRQLAVEFG
jgi:DUF1016 N-terminal domain